MAAKQSPRQPQIDGIHIGEVLGTGSFATVFSAHAGGKQVAVKTLFAHNVELRDAALREARILHSVQHRNVVALVLVAESNRNGHIHSQQNTILGQNTLVPSINQSTDADKLLVNNTVSLVLEHCEADLFDAITAKQGFDTAKAIELFEQLCTALLHCHSKGVYHRDLKPENILLANGKVKLADFGLATTSATSTDFGCGSIRYNSPECFKGNTPYNCASNDIWALGIILINLLTSKNPWVEPTHTDKHFNVHILQYNKHSHKRDSFATQFNFPPKMCLLLRQIFSIDPSKRPQIPEIMRQLESIYSHTKQAYVPMSPSSQTSMQQPMYNFPAQITNKRVVGNSWRPSKGAYQSHNHFQDDEMIFKLDQHSLKIPAFNAKSQTPLTPQTPYAQPQPPPITTSTLHPAEKSKRDAVNGDGNSSFYTYKRPVDLVSRMIYGFESVFESSD